MPLALYVSRRFTDNVRKTKVFKGNDFIELTR
nr:MAG TPA: hypothetical protein [Caudoviricetes sp.]DAS23957.1 MAG TPA: hypothetical protein [Caudoviricetes sp.]